MHYASLAPTKLGVLIKKLSKNQHHHHHMRLSKEDDRDCTKYVQAHKGFVAIYVGMEAKRYQVPLELFSSPTMKQLLKEEYEDDVDIKIDGPIAISSCEPDTFDRLLMEITRASVRR